MASTSRQRMLDAFDYNNPDRIPVVYHPSPAGLYVHGQKLLDLFNAFPPDNPISFDHIPEPAPETIDENGRYHERKKDEWGIEYEYLIFGIAGHPKKHPFSDWEAAAEYTFPPLPSSDPDAFAKRKKSIDEQREDYLTFAGGPTVFERLHALRPMDEVLMDLHTQEEDLMVFLDRLVEHWEAYIRDQIELGADVIMFGDDWGMQDSTIISPRSFREVFKPRYEKLIKPIKEAGRKVFFHSCGYLGEIFDELLDLGIDGLWPQILLYERLPGAIAKCTNRKVSIYIHPDRQKLIPLGKPQEIEDAIRMYAERYHQAGGGGIFYVEIENDAPFENVEALIRSVDRYR